MKNPSELITIILPVYNAEKYLSECIISIIEQTYQNLEIIIVNDGSTDNSENIIKEFQKKDSRIIYHSQNNLGLIRTLNKAIDMANGKYIARMDADDVCLPTRIEVQYEHMKRENSDVSGGFYYEIDSDGEKIRERYVPIQKNIIDIALCSRVPFAHPSVMFKSLFLKENNIKYNEHNKIYAEDLELWNRMYCKGAVFTNINEFLIKYRVLNSSLSRKNQLKIYSEAMFYTSVFYREYVKNKECNLNKIDIESMNIEEKYILLSFLVRGVIFNKNLKNIFYITKFDFKTICISALREIKQLKTRWSFLKGGSV